MSHTPIILGYASSRLFLAILPIDPCRRRDARGWVKLGVRTPLTSLLPVKGLVFTTKIGTRRRSRSTARQERPAGLLCGLELGRAGTDAGRPAEAHAAGVHGGIGEGRQPV